MLVGAEIGFGQNFEVLPELVNYAGEVEVTIGSGATTNTGALAQAVDLSKTLRIYNGQRSSDSSSRDRTQMRVSLTDVDECTAYVNSTGAQNRISRLTALEFKPWAVINCEEDSLSITAGNLTATKQVSFTTPTAAQEKDVIYTCLGNTSTTASDFGRLSKAFCSIRWYTSGGNHYIEATRGNSAGDMTVGYCVMHLAPGIVRTKTDALVTISGATATANLTIPKVRTANTLLLWNGEHYSDGFDPTRMDAYLAGATTITGNRGGNGNTSNMRLCVVEFYPQWVVAKAGGEEAFALDTATKDVTVTTLAAGKSFATYLGLRCNNNFDYTSASLATTSLQSTTNVRLLRASGTDFSNARTVSYEAMQLR